MGWKGTLRSLEASARRAEKERIRKQKIRLKNQMIASAASDVSEHQKYMEAIQSLHHKSTNYVDWKSLLSMPPPKEPQQKNVNEQSANSKVENFKPSFFQKTLGRSEKVLGTLKTNVELAKNEDIEKYNISMAKYESALISWKEDRDISERLFNKEPEAISEVIQEFQTLTEIDGLGKSIVFRIRPDGYIHAMVDVNSIDIIPDQDLNQLASGKLSVKSMPKTRRNEMYQDYVCSVALKVADDIFNLIPTSRITVSCVDEMLNTTTGLLEKQAILSVEMPKETILKLNFERLDPSDSMGNFVHNMKFVKSKGFSPIEPLIPLGEVD